MHVLLCVVSSISVSFNCESIERHSLKDRLDSDEVSQMLYKSNSYAQTYCIYESALKYLFYFCRIELLRSNYLFCYLIIPKRSQGGEPAKDYDFTKQPRFCTKVINVIENKCLMKEEVAKEFLNSSFSLLVSLTE